MSETRKLDLAVVDDANRPYIVEWLRDRSAFHTWFSLPITGSFVVITVLGSKPGFDTPSAYSRPSPWPCCCLSLLGTLVCVLWPG